MKKTLVFAALMLCSAFAGAVTWYAPNGVLYGNICRNGAYYTAYPLSMGQPVGTVCPIRDAYNNIIGTGVVSNE
jgi:hypothetical protein